MLRYKPIVSTRTVRHGDINPETDIRVTAAAASVVVAMVSSCAGPIGERARRLSGGPSAAVAAATAAVAFDRVRKPLRARSGGPLVARGYVGIFIRVHLRAATSLCLCRLRGSNKSRQIARVFATAIISVAVVALHAPHIEHRITAAAAARRPSRSIPHT